MSVHSSSRARGRNHLMAEDPEFAREKGRIEQINQRRCTTYQALTAQVCSEQLETGHISAQVISRR